MAGDLPKAHCGFQLPNFFDPNGGIATALSHLPGLRGPMCRGVLMMKVCSQVARGAPGMTLPEVVISLAIGAMVFGGVLTTYIQGAIRAEWAAYNLAGHSLALQRLEQARAAKWDTQSSPPVDLVVATNFPNTVDVLDIPISGTNITYATNFVTISQVSANPPLKLFSVDTVWAFRPGKVFTNSTASYRAPDQ